MKKIKYFFNRFRFLKALNSPFKPFKLKWYFGKVAIGTPYFLPRKWVNLTEKEIEEKAIIQYNKIKEEFKEKVTLEHYIQQYKGTQKAIPKLFGFDFVGLGWKTKWEWNDYRFEWNPVWSFVFFKWQIALIFAPKEDENHYWECWLAYSIDTDKTKSTKERIEQAKKDFPCIWSSYKDGVKTTICYWDKVLKKKWL